MSNGSAKLIHCFSGDARHIRALRRGPWPLLLLHPSRCPSRRLHSLLQGSSLQEDHHLSDHLQRLRQRQHNHFSLHRPCRPRLPAGRRCRLQELHLLLLCPPLARPSLLLRAPLRPPRPRRLGILLRTHRERVHVRPPRSPRFLRPPPPEPLPRPRPLPPLVPHRHFPPPRPHQGHCLHNAPPPMTSFASPSPGRQPPHPTLHVTSFLCPPPPPLPPRNLPLVTAPPPCDHLLPLPAPLATPLPPHDLSLVAGPPFHNLLRHPFPCLRPLLATSSATLSPTHPPPRDLPLVAAAPLHSP